jgi:hypothetical protein
MYTIEQEKLEQVTAIFNRETDPQATDALIRAEICADWHEESEHQEWIDNTGPQEIADWLARFYVHTITCPFCNEPHPDDVKCGCQKETAEAMRLFAKIEQGQRLTAEENWFLATWESL